MKKEKLSEIVLAILTGLVLVILIGIHVDVNLEHYCSQLDADIASEALLATEIADNGFSMPDTWVGSSFVRVINAPNLGALIYKFNGDMNLSVGIACSIMMIILIVLMGIYYKQLGFKLYEVLSVLIILFSLSDVQSENQSILFLWAAYYVSYFITLFLMLVFYNLCLKGQKVPIWVWVISLLVAFLQGIQGLHGCLFCYFPVLGVEILRRLWLWKKKEKESWIAIVWLTITALLSFVTSRVYGAYGFGTSRNIRHAGEKFINEVWPALGKVVYFGEVPIAVGVLCFLAFLGYLCAIRCIFTGNSNDINLKRDEIADGEKIRNSNLLWGMLATIISIAIFILSLSFTTMEVATRYFITELFIVATGVGLFMNLFRGQNTKVKTSSIVAVIVVILGIISSKYYYSELIAGDNSGSSDEMLVANWMKDNEYEYGYAIFDNANTITVMANNEVKVRAVNNMKDMEGCKWLSDSAWYPPTKSVEGDTCYLVSASAINDFDEFLKERTPAIVDTCEIGRYKVYVLDHDYTVWKD